MKKFLSILFVCVCCSLFSYDYDLSICAIFQNEALYLREWIDYHRQRGVEHFYLYNNESTDDYLAVLSPYIKKNIVEVIDWPNLWPEIFFGYGCQAKAYDHCLQRCKGKTKWLAVIDTDEFIVPKILRQIPTTLETYYPDAAAVYAQWLQFGTSNKKLYGKSITKHLRRCAPINHPWNTYGKSIIRPELVIYIDDPHLFKLVDGATYYDGDGHVKTDSIHRENFIRINHYTYRDECFFWNIKVQRALKWGIDLHELLQKNKEYSECEDRFILNLL